MRDLRHPSACDAADRHDGSVERRDGRRPARRLAAAVGRRAAIGVRDAGPGATGALPGRVFDTRCVDRPQRALDIVWWYAAGKRPGCTADHACAATGTFRGLIFVVVDHGYGADHDDP